MRTDLLEFPQAINLILQQLLSQYIDALFAKYQELYVLRFDLGISKRRVEKPRSLKDMNAQIYLRQFFQNWRTNRLFSNIAGYIWFLEPVRGAENYFHMIFFLSESDQFKYGSERWGEEIGNYWVNVTQGGGYYLDCRASASIFKSECVSLLKSNDRGRRDKLSKLLWYLTHKRCTFDFRDKGNSRTMGHGYVNRRAL